MTHDQDKENEHEYADFSGDADVAGGADDDFAPEGEEDFGDEDWESFDGEDFIDDSDADDGSAARKAALSKVIFLGAGLLVLAGAWYLFFGGEKENLGLPAMEQVSEMAPVGDGQKVEFHAETKVPAKDPYGIAYGQAVPDDTGANAQQDEKKGLLNNPEMIDRIRGGERVTYEGTGIDSERQPRTGLTGPEVVSEQPPMPAPISSAGTQESGGLIPMPQDFKNKPDSEGAFDQQVGGFDPDRAPSGRIGAAPALPAAADVAKGGEVAEGDISALAQPDAQIPRQPSAEPGDLDLGMLEDEFGDSAGATDDLAGISDDPAAQKTAGSEAMTSSGDISGQLADILDRLEAIEQGQRNNSTTLKTLQGRLEKLETAPPSRAQARAANDSSAPARAPSSVKQSSSPAAQKWLLKAAQPGQAMVSRSGQSDMMSVSVGDELAGIGRITSIMLQNGQWVVQGTNGKITQ